MLPIDSALVPAQAMARGGTFVRPGAVAWGGTRDAPDGGYSSCEAVEQVLAAVVKDAARINDLLGELSCAKSPKCMPYERSWILNTLLHG